jgi:hypothetical protein
LVAEAQVVEPAVVQLSAYNLQVIALAKFPVIG